MLTNMQYVVPLAPSTDCGPAVLDPSDGGYLEVRTVLNPTSTVYAFDLVAFHHYLSPYPPLRCTRCRTEST